MADLRTSYMGIELQNPLVVGACSLSNNIDRIKLMEQTGAGALVLKSLFEEQIQQERAEIDEELSKFEGLYPEALTLFPRFEHGPKQHLYWVTEARKAVKMPLIASLNAVTEKVWVSYARQLAETGVDGLELSFYSLPLDPSVPAADIEARELETFSRVKEAVKVPVAVKLHPFYTNVFRHAAELSGRGAAAVVLFNRLFQPDIHLEGKVEWAPMVLSKSSDGLLSLRWIALLYDRIQAQLVANTGVQTGLDAAKMILAGADAVQVVSALYRNDIRYLGQMLDQLARWMDAQGYAKLADFRGKVSKKEVKDPWAFERAQYIKALLGFD